MGGFLYYIPGGRTGLHLDDLARKGLGYAFDRATLSVREIVGPGPDGKPAGAIVCDHRRQEKCGYFPPEQEWRAIPGNEAGVWVGYFRAEKPGPAGLAREKMLDGYPVELADGNRWQAPTARAPWGEPTLPRGVSFGADGKWAVGDVVAAHASLWVLAQRFWDARLGALAESDGETIRFDFDGLHDAAVECLGANYAIGRIEAGMLGLFVTGSAVTILEALIDWPRVVEILKKTIDQTLEGSATSPGPPADSPATALPLPTSGSLSET